MSVPWRTRQVALGIVLVAVAALLVSQAIVWPVGRENLALIAWLTSLSLGVVIFALVWLLALRPYRVSLSSLGLKPVGVPSLKVVGITLGASLISLGVTPLYAFLVRLSGVEMLLPKEPDVSIIFPGFGIVLTFLALAVWTPLTEEVFFRGFIFAGLSSRWGTSRAMLISAAIFSGFHILLGVLIPIFIIGLLLAWLYHHTGSLWSSIVVHAGLNAAALAFTILRV